MIRGEERMIRGEKEMQLVFAMQNVKLKYSQYRMAIRNLLYWQEHNVGNLNVEMNEKMFN